jgi:DNA replication protein DnaC
MTQSVALNQMSKMKFHGMMEAYKTILDSNRHHDLNPEELINHLLQAEWEERENRKINRLYRTAKFRYSAAVEELEFSPQRGLDKMQVLRLADVSFIKKKENILITGATGSGKSYIASALGNQACMQGFRTLYYNTTKLFPKLKMLKADGSYMKEIARIEKQDLLILDDFGIQQLDQMGRMALLEIIEDRHGRASTIVASQLPVTKWFETIGDSTIADAILDRLAHTAHRIELKGESMRKKQ